MSITFDEIKQEKDLQEVKKIYDWYIANSTATFHTEPIRIDQLMEFMYLDHPLYKSYLIKDDGKITGYCYFTYYKKRQAYDRTAEVTIYLTPGTQGKGIGKTGLTYLEKKGKELGLKNLLGIITGDNHTSISLFEKSGYTKCAHFKNVGEKFDRILDVVAFQKEI